MEAKKSKKFLLYLASGLILLAVAAFVIYNSLGVKGPQSVFLPNNPAPETNLTPATSSEPVASSTAASSTQAVIPEKIEYATDKEKVDMLGIWTEPGAKVQVLSRDAKGQILDYKIIKP